MKKRRLVLWNPLRGKIVHFLIIIVVLFWSVSIHGITRKLKGFFGFVHINDIAYLLVQTKKYHVITVLLLLLDYCSVLLTSGVHSHITLPISMKRGVMCNLAPLCSNRLSICEQIKRFQDTERSGRWHNSTKYFMIPVLDCKPYHLMY